MYLSDLKRGQSWPHLTSKQDSRPCTSTRPSHPCMKHLLVDTSRGERRRCCLQSMVGGSAARFAADLTLHFARACVKNQSLLNTYVSTRPTSNARPGRCCDAAGPSTLQATAWLQARPCGQTGHTRRSNEKRRFVQDRSLHQINANTCLLVSRSFILRRVFT